MYPGVRGCMRVYADVHGYAQLYLGVGGCVTVGLFVQDEFSEYLLEIRVHTSADFNTYPIQIFKIRKESRENSISGNFYLGRSCQKIREIQFHGIF